VSTITHSVIRNCPNCDADLPLEALACPQCHSFVHSVRLDQLAKDARALEVRGLFAQARELWEYSLPLLPQDSKQAEWVRERIRALELAQAGTQAETQQPASGPQPPKQKAPTPNWVKKLGPFGPIGLLLLKFKSALFLVFKLKFLFSFAFFIFFYITLFGWRYGLGISACILIHELGHFIDIKRRGLPADMPVFLPGLGAYVRWTGLGVTRRQIAQISLAGPLAGWIAAAVCFLIYAQTRDPLWAALARTGAFLNTLNLIPVWILDGGKAAFALAAVDRAALLALTLGLWYYTGEGLFFFVAAGITWRLFTKDKPQQSDLNVWLYYAALLVALAVLLHETGATLASRGITLR
jgi:Zn-dependent protease